MGFLKWRNQENIWGKDDEAEEYEEKERFDSRWKIQKVLGSKRAGYQKKMIPKL